MNDTHRSVSLDGAQQAAADACDAMSPADSALARDVVSRLADTWAMWTLHVLADESPLRFSRIAERVEGVSQKMLTKTLRQLERDGLVTRTMFMEVPPRVEYALTPIGRELHQRFLPLWGWAVENVAAFRTARERFDRGKAAKA